MTAVLLALATVFYAAAIVFIARASVHTDSNLAGGIINGLGALIPIGAFLMARQASAVSQSSAKGIWLAVAGGVSIALYTIAFTKLFARGGDISYASPLVYGGAILLSSLVGMLFFKEPVERLQLFGILAIVIGIISIVFAKVRIS